MGVGREGGEVTSKERRQRKKDERWRGGNRVTEEDDV
jgi:hypothetical protein